MRARWSPVIVACSLVGCGSGEQGRIGDAYPREGEQAVFLSTIEPAVEKTGAQIARWTGRLTTDQTSQTSGMYNALVGDVFNRYWDAGVDGYLRGEDD